jgi:hypothetical protein
MGTEGVFIGQMRRCTDCGSTTCISCPGLYREICSVYCLSETCSSSAASQVRLVVTPTCVGLGASAMCITQVRRKMSRI